MIVILDTSAIVASSRVLQSPALQTLFKAQSSLHLKVVVPQVVVEELVKKQREALEAAVPELRRAIDSVNRLVGVPIEWQIDEDFTSDQVNSYRQLIETEFGKFSVQVVPYPEIFAEDVFFREVHSIKPYNSKGVGFRDYLIWLNVLQIRKQTPSHRNVVFVSNNADDFFQDRELQLHSHLMDDLDRFGLPVDSVQVLRTVDELSREIIEPKLDRVLDVGSYALQEIERQASQTVQEWFDSHPAHLIPPYSLRIVNQWARVTDIRVGRVTKWSSVLTYEIATGELLVRALLECHIDVSYIEGSAEDASRQGVSFDNYLVPNGPKIEKSLEKKFMISATLGPGPEYTIQTFKADPVLDKSTDAIPAPTIDRG